MEGWREWMVMSEVCELDEYEKMSGRVGYGMVMGMVAAMVGSDSCDRKGMWIDVMLKD